MNLLGGFFMSARAVRTAQHDRADGTARPWAHCWAQWALMEIDSAAAPTFYGEGAYLFPVTESWRSRVGSL